MELSGRLSVRANGNVSLNEKPIPLNETLNRMIVFLPSVLSPVKLSNEGSRGIVCVSLFVFFPGCFCEYLACFRLSVSL